MKGSVFFIFGILSLACVPMVWGYNLDQTIFFGEVKEVDFGEEFSMQEGDVVILPLNSLSDLEIGLIYPYPDSIDCSLGEQDCKTVGLNYATEYGQSSTSFLHSEGIDSGLLIGGAKVTIRSLSYNEDVPRVDATFLAERTEGLTKVISELGVEFTLDPTDAVNFQDKFIIRYLGYQSNIYLEVEEGGDVGKVIKDITEKELWCSEEGICLNRISFYPRTLNSELYVVPSESGVRLMFDYTSDPITCEDSDGGSNVFVKGITTGISPASGEVSSVEDTCFSDNSPSDRGDELMENYCEDQEMKSSVLFCDKGCEDGACIGEDANASEVSNSYTNNQNINQECGRFMCKVINFFKRLLGRV